MREGKTPAEASAQERSPIQIRSRLLCRGTIVSINVCILGDSGTGKSSSIRNLDPSRTALLKAVDKPLPCRSAVPSRFVESFGQAISAMRAAAESGRDIIILMTFIPSLPAVHGSSSRKGIRQVQRARPANVVLIERNDGVAFACKGVLLLAYGNVGRESQGQYNWKDDR